MKNKMNIRKKLKNKERDVKIFLIKDKRFVNKMNKEKRKNV
jgi:hypothetical protein